MVEVSRSRLVAEVLELGESLFEITLEAASHQATEGGKSEAYPVEELWAAAGEFFSTLRLLLGIDHTEDRTTA